MVGGPLPRALVHGVFGGLAGSLAVTVDQALAGASLVAGALQLILASRRDLGPLTLGLVGATVAWGMPDRVLLDGVIGSLALFAAAEVRGARNGVGRPSHTGMATLAAASAIVASLFVAGPAPAVGSVVFGALLAVAALDRPSSREQRAKWYRVVPVDAG